MQVSERQGGDRCVISTSYNAVIFSPTRGIILTGVRWRLSHRVGVACAVAQSPPTRKLKTTCFCRNHFRQRESMDMADIDAACASAAGIG